MYQLNPLYDILSESFNRIWNQAQTLSPEARKRYLQHYAMARFGKPNGTINDAATEYAKRYIKGQIKRAKYIAKLNNRPGVVITKVKEPLASEAGPNGLGITQHIPRGLVTGKRNIDRIVNHGYDSIVVPRSNSKFPKDIVRRYSNKDSLSGNTYTNPANDRFLRTPINHRVTKKNKRIFSNYDNESNIALTNANITGHEVDEYQEMFRNAELAGMKPDDVGVLLPSRSFKHQVPDPHFPGVLKRERDRLHKWNSMFGRNKATNPARHPVSSYYDNIPLDFNND